MRPIRKLSESLILKIAAGEVVERPASVVKELVENSLDAGATRVEVRVIGGGLGSIRVTDDGRGIPPEEVPLAFERHATSKIERIEDLSEVRTLGFRGEALPTIGGVSHLELLTRASGEESGTLLRLEGGEIRKVEPHGAAPGTTVSVSDLFFNTPARRKFMRSKSTEFGQIDRTIRRISLANLGVEFILEHEGERILHLPATDRLSARVAQLYGRELAASILPFEGKSPPLSVTGVVSDPKIGFGRASEISFLANGRPIQDRMLTSAVMEGYRTLRMEHRYPLAVVAIEIPPALLDVNVHPAKTEVRFADPQSVFRIVSSSIATLFRSSTPADFPLPSPLSFQPPLGFGDRVTLSLAASAPALYLPETPPAPLGRFSSLTYAGALDQTYLLFRAPDALYVVDQHAAHERVLFEELKSAQETASPPSQPLLLPITLELSSEREGALISLLPFLRGIGFDLEPFGPRTFLVRAAPAAIGTRDPRPLLLDLADAETAQEGVAPLLDRTDALLSRAACHAAVRAHDPMTPEEVSALTRRMDHTDLSSHCPHGRPTFLRFSLGDLELLFHRK